MVPGAGFVPALLFSWTLRFPLRRRASSNPTVPGVAGKSTASPWYNASSRRLGRVVIRKLWAKYESWAKRRGFVLLLLGIFVAAGWGLIGLLRPWRELPRSTWPCGFEAGRIARNLIDSRGYGSPFALRPGEGFWIEPGSSGPGARPDPAPDIGPVPPTAWITPPNVSMWVLVFGLFGVYTPAAWAAYLGLQVLLMAGALYLLWRVLALSAGGRAAAVGLLLLLAYPLVWSIPLTDTHSSTLFVFLLASSLYALARWLGGGRWLWLALHALAAALAVLSEASAVLFLAAFEGWLAVRGVRLGEPPGGKVPGCPPVSPGGWRLSRSATVLLTAVLACLLAWGPWLVRNWRILGAPVLLKSNLGVELWLGNNPDALAGFLHSQVEHAVYSNESERRLLLEMGEPAYARICFRRFADFVSARPGDFIVLTSRRVLHFWTLLPGKTNPARPALTVLFLACLALYAGLRWRERLRRHGGLAGPDRPWLESAAVCFLLWYPAAYYVTHFLLYRYRFPLEIMLLVALACALARAFPPEPEGPAAVAD